MSALSYAMLAITLFNVWFAFSDKEKRKIFIIGVFVFSAMLAKSISIN